MGVIKRATNKEIKNAFEVNDDLRNREVSAAETMGRKPHIRNDFFTGIYEMYHKNEV